MTCQHSHRFGTPKRLIMMFFFKFFENAYHELITTFQHLKNAAKPPTPRQLQHCLPQFRGGDCHSTALHPWRLLWTSGRERARRGGGCSSSVAIRDERAFLTGPTCSSHASQESARLCLHSKILTAMGSSRLGPHLVSCPKRHRCPGLA